MSRSYRMVSYLEVGTKLSLEDCGYWQDILYRCLDEPQDVILGEEPSSSPDDVDVSFIYDGTTQFYLNIERCLGGGYSEDEYAADFQKALHILTKGTALDFKVSLSLYYLEHDPDLYLSFNRQDLAV